MCESRAPENGADSPQVIYGSVVICTLCKGSGVTMGGDEYQACPKCSGSGSA